MHIRLLAFENQVGNSRDVMIMCAALQSLGCEVQVTRLSRAARRWRRSELVQGVARARRLLRGVRHPPAPAYAVNVMLEHIWPQFLHAARWNVVVPNPEWFDRFDQRMVSLVDRIWAKTQYGLGVFAALGRPTSFIGFDSVDRYDAGVPRQAECFHLAGKSRMKGTGRLLRQWAQHPQWPMLTVVHSRHAGFAGVQAANIRYETRYLEDATLQQLQNRHRYHLCLSETEGWGHYIPEALSVGAIVLSTDAPPMNELVTAERGVPISCDPLATQHLATTYAYREPDLERGLGKALSLAAPDRQRIQDCARAWFADNKRAFVSRLRQALEELDGASAPHR